MKTNQVMIVMYLVVLFLLTPMLIMAGLLYQAVKDARAGFNYTPYVALAIILVFMTAIATLITPVFGLVVAYGSTIAISQVREIQLDLFTDHPLPTPFK